MKERLRNPIGKAILLLRRIRLYPRLILLTLFCGILPLTVFSLFVLRTAQDTYMRSNYQNIQQCLELYTSLVDEEMQKYTGSATKLASYTDTVRAITNSNANSLNQYVFLNNYKRYLGNVYISLGRLYSIEIVSLKKPVLAISYSFTNGNVSENEAIQRAEASGETCFWQSVDSGSMWKGSAVQAIAANRFLMLTVPVENITSRQKIGYVNYFISDVLFSDLSKKIEKYQTFQTNQHYMDDILIVDRDNRIIFARDAGRIGGGTAGIHRGDAGGVRPAAECGKRDRPHAVRVPEPEPGFCFLCRFPAVRLPDGADHRRGNLYGGVPPFRVYGRCFLYPVHHFRLRSLSFIHCEHQPSDQPADPQDEHGGPGNAGRHVPGPRE